MGSWVTARLRRPQAEGPFCSRRLPFNVLLKMLKDLLQGDLQIRAVDPKEAIFSFERSVVGMNQRPLFLRVNDPNKARTN